jgi:hypothetical protein
MTKNYSLKSLISVFTLFFLIKGFGLKAQVPVLISLNGPASVCSPPAALPSFSAVATNGPNTYNWSVSPAAGVSYGNSTGSVTTIAFSNPNVTYTVYCYASNAFGNSTTKSVVVQVFETPSVTFSGAQTNLCQGSPTFIQASATIVSASSTMSYTWVPGTGLSSYNTYSTVATLQNTTTYSVHLAINSCTNMQTVTLNVFGGPCTLGIEKNRLEESTMAWPNPNNGAFKVSSNIDTQVNVINELGQKVRTFYLEAREEKEITGLKSGVYFVIAGNSRHKIIVTD